MTPPNILCPLPGYPNAHICLPVLPDLPFIVMGEYTRRGYSATYLASGGTADEALENAKQVIAQGKDPRWGQRR